MTSNTWQDRCNSMVSDILVDKAVNGMRLMPAGGSSTTVGMQLVAIQRQQKTTCTRLMTDIWNTFVAVLVQHADPSVRKRACSCLGKIAYEMVNTCAIAHALEAEAPTATAAADNMGRRSELEDLWDPRPHILECQAVLEAMYGTAQQESLLLLQAPPMDAAAPRGLSWLGDISRTLYATPSQFEDEVEFMAEVRRCLDAHRTLSAQREAADQLLTVFCNLCTARGWNPLANERNACAAPADGAHVEAPTCASSPGHDDGQDTVIIGETLLDGGKAWAAPADDASAEAESPTDDEGGQDTDIIGEELLGGRNAWTTPANGAHSDTRTCASSTSHDDGKDTVVIGEELSRENSIGVDVRIVLASWPVSEMVELQKLVEALPGFIGVLARERREDTGVRELLQVLGVAAIVPSASSADAPLVALRTILDRLHTNLRASLADVEVVDLSVPGDAEVAAAQLSKLLAMLAGNDLPQQNLREELAQRLTFAAFQRGAKSGGDSVSDSDRGSAGDATCEPNCELLRSSLCSAAETNAALSEVCAATPVRSVVVPGSDCVSPAPGTSFQACPSVCSPESASTRSSPMSCDSGSESPLSSATASTSRSHKSDDATFNDDSAIYADFTMGGTGDQ